MKRASKRAGELSRANTMFAAAQIGRRRHTLRAFTYAEAIIVVVVLLTISAAVMPRIIAIDNSKRLLDLQADIARLPTQAANEAIAVQTPCRLRLDGQTLVLEEDPLTGAPTTLKQISLGTDVAVVEVETGGKPGIVGSWQWMVYPDGSSDDAAIQFRVADHQQVLMLQSNGTSRWLRGTLSDSEPTWWPAGNFQPTGA